LTDPRDPKDFVADLEIIMPRPTIVLTRQDAVTQELLKFSRTMSTRDVLRTAQALNEEAEALGYDPLLLLALIHVESFYDHLALSPVGAEGLMQLMPPTAEWMAGRLRLRWDEGHTFDPVLNVRLGAQYLAYLHREFGRMDYALTAYNRGPQATRFLVDRFGSLPAPVYDFYAGRVLGYYEKLKAMYGKLPMG
jgi:soluble lytic murein transglycosylase